MGDNNNKDSDEVVCLPDKDTKSAEVYYFPPHGGSVLNKLQVNQNFI